MRPTRLELEGFASFRERTSIDFTDAELFVLTGPTGAGKSSVIDAITFALYGLVHRHGGKDVAPVITQGRQEARVRLTFEVDGASYTAVRVVQRTKSGGANTREARLEHGAEVLAGNASELGERINKLIGLPFEHFTKCVVLPQGEFARFLHDKPGDRQDLLVRLLELEIYGRMASAATQRQKNAEAEILRAQQRLATGLAGATPEARDAEKATIAKLEALAKRIDRERPKLDELRERGKEHAKAESVAAALALQLDKLAGPLGDLELARKVESGQKSLAHATKMVEKAKTDLVAAETARKKLPDPQPLRKLQQDLERQARQQAELDKTTKALAAARKKQETAAKALAAAVADLQAKEKARDVAERTNLGASLAAKLAVGDLCPVCGTKVRTLPHAEAPKDLKKAQAAAEAAKRAREQADADHRALQVAAEKLNGELGLHQREIDALARSLAKAPALADIAAKLAGIAAADRALEAAREKREDADAERGKLSQQLDRLRESESVAWQRLDQLRDALAVLGPPALDRRDLAAAWSRLVDWARGEAPNQRERAAGAAAEKRAVAASIDEINVALRAALLEAGLDAGRGDPRSVCGDGLAQSKVNLKSIEAGIAEARSLTGEIARHQETFNVAKSLALHLGARNFESWVLNRVMRGLAAGASQRLLELSRDQYSFELDEKNREFLVVDHHNGGEMRSARTLSGGETFLASLALSLALSEHVSQLAVRGAARLDALFLDEGFGALDPDTLEVVAGAIEELGARGHMVGIVTHVGELADRIPVRFEVTKDATTSRVRRFDGDAESIPERAALEAD